MVIINSFIGLDELRRIVGINEVENILPVDTEYATGPGTISIDTKGGNGSDNIAGAKEVRAARVTEAGSAGIRIVGKQEGEIACEAGIDLIQLGVGDITSPRCRVLPGSGIRKTLLQTVADGGKSHILLAAFRLQRIQLIHAGKGTILA